MMHGDVVLVDVPVPETSPGWKHHRNVTGHLEDAMNVIIDLCMF